MNGKKAVLGRPRNNGIFRVALIPKSPLFFNFRIWSFYRNLFGVAGAFKLFLAYISYFCNIPLSRRPLTVNFLVSSECNLKCGICSYQEKRNFTDGQLDLPRVERFIAGLAKYKPVLFFSGGEPLIRRDFFKILRFTKEQGLRCGVNTNGCLLDPSRIDELVSLSVELVIFSLYGLKDVHDSVTGVDGSFEQSTANIREFCRKKNKNTRVIVSCTINKLNAGRLDEIPRLAMELGADAVKFEHLNFLTPAESAGQPAAPKANTLIAEADGFSAGFAGRLSAELQGIRKAYPGFVMVKPDLSAQEIMSWYSGDFATKRRCLFPWHSVFVKPDGMVIPCQFLQDYSLGNIADGELKDIFNNNRMSEFRKLLRKGLFRSCSRCCKL